MTATFIGVTPKDCPLCSNKLTPQKTKLINIGNEKFLKHFYRCVSCDHRVQHIEESKRLRNDAKRSG